MPSLDDFLLKIEQYESNEHGVALSVCSNSVRRLVMIMWDVLQTEISAARAEGYEAGKRDGWEERAMGALAHDRNDDR